MSNTLTITAAVTPTAIRLSITRAKTAIYYLVILNADGTPMDLEAGALYFHASNGLFSLDKSSTIGGSPAVLQGILITSAATGLATMTISPTDTDTLGASGVFGMPCEITLTGGSPAGSLQLATGNLTISPNVGTP
jgi:hypothetical protein